MTFFDELARMAVDEKIDDWGIVSAGDAWTFPQFQQWIQLGRHGTMAYLARNVEARRHPRSILPQVRSMIVVVLSQKTLFDESVCAGPQSFRTQNEDSTRQPSLFAENFDPGKTLPRIDTSNSVDTPNQNESGEVLTYTVLEDYHHALRRRLKTLEIFVQESFPDAQTRIAVDSAPLLEKEWACRAGLGAIGRHSLLIHPKWGSRVFLGFLLVSVDLAAVREPNLWANVASKANLSNNVNEGNRIDKVNENNKVGWTNKLSRVNEANEENTDKNFFDANEIVSNDLCGTCRRCVQACPTRALTGDRTLLAHRCLNYWTLEHRGDDIPEEIRRKLGNRLVGCDVCQQVCPWNRDETTPDKMTPDEMTPDEMTPDEMTPDEMTPIVTMPDKTTPIEITPDGTTPIKMMGRTKWTRPVSLSFREIQAMTSTEFRQKFQQTPLFRGRLKTLQRNLRWLGLREDDETNRKDANRDGTGREETGREETGREETGREETGRDEMGWENAGH